MLCGSARGAKGLSVIPAFLHMSWDGPKPQALTPAAVPAHAAKIYCEEYSCSPSKCAPFGFIAEEHKVHDWIPQGQIGRLMTASTTESNGLEQNCEKRWLLKEGLLKQSDSKRSENIAASQIQSGHRPGRFCPHSLYSMKKDAHISQARTRASLIKEDLIFSQNFIFWAKMMMKNDHAGVERHL